MRPFTVLTRELTREFTRELTLVLAAVAMLLVGGAPALASATVSAGAVGGGQLANPGQILWARGSTTPLPAISATSWLVADLDSGEVLAAKGAHQRLRPASTLKTLTALTLLPLLDPAATYVGTAEDANAEGSRAGIVPGGKYTVHDLWDALLLPSGNDAAHALAMANGGLARTVQQMNLVARHLQALDTTAVNPSGLDADGQFSSAYDLALIARAGLARSDFSAYVRSVSSPFPGRPKAGGAPGPTFRLWNQNKLLTGYPGAIGVKAGYTTLAQNTYVAAAQRSKHRLVVTLLHSQRGAWKEARALLEWGFRNQAALHPVGTLVEPVPGALPEASLAASNAASSSISASRAALRTRQSTSGPPWTLGAAALLAATAVCSTLARRLAKVHGGRPVEVRAPNGRSAGRSNGSAHRPAGRKPTRS